MQTVDMLLDVQTGIQKEKHIQTDIKMLTIKLANSHAHSDRRTDRQTYTKGPTDGQTDIDIHIT